MKNDLKKGFTLVELMITITVVGILGVLAVPAYQDYAIKAQVAEGFSLLSEAKVGYEEHYSLTGTAPNETQANSFLSNPKTNYIEGMFFNEASGVNSLVALFGEDAHKEISGKSLHFIPEIKETNIVWTCGGDIDRKFLPSSCIEVTAVSPEPPITEPIEPPVTDPVDPPIVEPEPPTEPPVADPFENFQYQIENSTFVDQYGQVIVEDFQFLHLPDGTITARGPGLPHNAVGEFDSNGNLVFKTDGSVTLFNGIVVDSYVLKPFYDNGKNTPEIEMWGKDSYSGSDEIIKFEGGIGGYSTGPNYPDLS